MAKGKKTGGKNFESGKSGNPDGMRKGAKQAANDFRDWCFSLFKEKKDDLKKSILSDDESKMQFLKLLVSMVPKEVDLGNTDDKPFFLKVVK
jgi:hypothetical protein